MFYIVGLGNPSPEYFVTRHNIGWLAVKKLGGRVIDESWKKDKILSAYVKNLEVGGQPVTLLLPTVFMNQSGVVTSVLKNKYRVNIEDIVVIHDDVDLPFGTIKISVGKGDGGNNGVKSVISSLQSLDFIRIRIGIAPIDDRGNKRRPSGGGSLERFVLQPFSADQAKKVPDILEKVENIVADLVTKGQVFVMNKYN